MNILEDKKFLLYFWLFLYGRLKKNQLTASKAVEIFKAFGTYYKNLYLILENFYLNF